MSDRDRYTTRTTIPCGDCAMAHMTVKCWKCAEAFDHRTLIHTHGVFACPPCSRKMVDDAASASDRGFTAFVALLILAAATSVLAGKC